MPKALPLIVAAVFYTLSSFAQDNIDPQQLKNQANAIAMDAVQRVRQAESMLRVDASEPSLRAVMPLYVQAGKSFEKAAQLYTVLSPNYASAQDVQNAVGAMQSCLQSIEEIKKRLRRLAASNHGG